MISYELYARYIGLVGLMTLSRNEFKKKVLDNFDLIAVYNEDKLFQDFLNCVYYAKYGEFFNLLIKLDESFISQD